MRILLPFVAREATAAVPKVNVCSGSASSSTRTKPARTTAMLSRTWRTEAMAGVSELNATGIREDLGELSGRQTAFDETQCSFAIQHLGKYKCALNFLWLGQPRISSFPLREDGIKSQQEHDFPTGPNRINKDIVVQIAHKEFKPSEHKGSLRVLSPEEPMIAFVRSLAEALAQNPTEAQKELYKAILLDTPVVFELIENEENAKFRAVAIREQITEDYFNMALTTWQRMLEVWSFRPHWRLCVFSFFYSTSRELGFAALY